MSALYKITLSDDLNHEIEKASAESGVDKEVIFRKSLQLLLIARKGKANGLQLGLIDPETDKMLTEIVGF